MFRPYLQTLAGSNNNRVVTLRCRNKHQNILVRKTANICRGVLSLRKVQVALSRFFTFRNLVQKEEMAGVGKGDSGGELLAKDAAKTWFSRKEKRGNTDTWSDDKRNKGEKNSRWGFGSQNEKGGWTDEGLVAWRSWCFETVRSNSKPIFSRQLFPRSDLARPIESSLLGLRCVRGESMWVSLIGTRGRSVGHMLFTRGDSWLVVHQFSQCLPKCQQSDASWHGAGCVVHGIWRLACKGGFGILGFAIFW